MHPNTNWLPICWHLGTFTFVVWFLVLGCYNSMHVHSYFEMTQRFQKDLRKENYFVMIITKIPKLLMAERRTPNWGFSRLVVAVDDWLPYVFSLYYLQNVSGLSLSLLNDSLLVKSMPFLPYIDLILFIMWYMICWS